MLDYKYIEQLIERYWSAETTLEEESILRTFFSQRDIPAEWEYMRALFSDEACGQSLGDDFDARMLEMIGENETAEPTVKACEIKLSQRLMPLFKAAAVVAIILTIGGALQAPWDKNWSSPEDFAAMHQAADTVVAVQPVQAENYAATDSTSVLLHEQSKD
jgi:hypothetical protein